MSQSDKAILALINARLKTWPPEAVRRELKWLANRITNGEHLQCKAALA